jgi:ubiquitin C-terminal hydrolase
MGVPRRRSRRIAPIARLTETRNCLILNFTSWFAKLPPVLIFQVFRFGNQGTREAARTRERRDHIQLPDRLKMAPWKHISPASTYVLHSVIDHFGTMHGAGTHYKAAVRMEGVWRLFDDLRVREVTDTDVHRMKAYILFYVLAEEEETLA